jgi:hypothetical protein
MQLDVEQLDKVPRIRRHHSQIMLKRIMPEERVWLARKAGMRDG